MSVSIYETFLNKFATYKDYFVDIETLDPDSMSTYLMTYKILELPDKRTDSEEFKAYNYVLDQEQTINLINVRSITYNDMHESEEFHLDKINDAKQYAGWKKEGWGLFDEDDEIVKSFKKKYFLSHNGSRISPEEAYMLARLDIKDVPALHQLSIEELRDKWLQMVISFKQQAVDMLNAEMVECEQQNLVDDIEEIKVIIEMLGEIDDEAETALSTCDTMSQIMSYWPALLLPAPVFCNLAYE